MTSRRVLRVASRHDIWSNDPAGLGDLLRRELRKVFLAKGFAGAEDEDILGGSLHLFGLAVLLRLICPFNREDRSLLLWLARGGCFLLLLIRPGCSREIGGVGLARHQVGVSALVDLVEQFSPEPAELCIEDRNVLRSGNDRRPGCPIEVLPTARIDRPDRLDQAHDLAAAERQPCIAQAPSQCQQVGQNCRFEHIL